MGHPIIYDGATNNIANGYGVRPEPWRSGKMRFKGKDPDEYANYRGWIWVLSCIIYLGCISIKLT